MKTQFQDRADAGRVLAAELQHHRGNPNLLVLALPRGGVPVAYEVAKELDAPLDIFLVRKLGVPIYEELAMGAIASGGVQVRNEDIIQRLGITERMIDSVAAEEQKEIARREKLYRGNRPPLEVSGRTVILIDDGLATGATMRAAVRALRKLHPSFITVAVPIGALDTCAAFREEADEVICAHSPEQFVAVGAWYTNFTQTTDDEVCALLNHAAHERRAQKVQSGKSAHEPNRHSPSAHHEAARG